jgi:tyrosyl-tRNA synthetase
MGVGRNNDVAHGAFDEDPNVSTPAFWQDFERRGIISQATSPTLGAWIADRLSSSKKVYVYCGFDPTADSLHIGGLMPVLGLRRLKQAGLTPIALVGGATGMIGDPSGKSAERTLLDGEALARNTAGLTSQLESLLEGRAGVDFFVLNNADWLAPLSFVEFLRDVGKHFSVNVMMAKESVRARLEDRDHGISYTEFSYMLLQAYDFLHLFEEKDCRLQVGGSDQWGNITAGIDLIHHKHHGAEVFGFTFPLITTASGQKFGKSERGNLWLDPRRTHPYFLYKYLFDTPDSEVMRFVRFFTFLPMEEIEALDRQTAESPQLRAGQRALAAAVTALVHGEKTAHACEGLEKAMHADDDEQFEVHAHTLGLLDPGSLEKVGYDDSVLPVAHRKFAELDAGISAVDLAVDIGLFASKSEVRREIAGKNSGFRIAGVQVTSPDFVVTRQVLGARRVLLVRKGKKNKRMVCFYE